MGELTHLELEPLIMQVKDLVTKELQGRQCLQRQRRPVMLKLSLYRK